MEDGLTSFIGAIRDAFPHPSFSEAPEQIAPHLREWRNRWHGRAAMVLRPGNRDELSRMLGLAHQHHVPIIAQGGNTGLVGGGVPDDTGREIPLSLLRMNRLRAVDPEGATMIAEAGVSIAAAQAAAAGAGLLFPLSLASEGSATIGGAAASNAGGVHVLRYGTMRELVLGVEAVLADGSVLDTVAPLRKNNSGYALGQLLIGSEGTLGIISAVALKLYPALKARSVAFAAVRGPADAITLLSLLRNSLGENLLAFELISRFGLDLVLRHISGSRDPLTTSAPFYVLVEAASPAASDDAALRQRLETALSEAMTAGWLLDATIAESEAQAASLWTLRHALSEAQKLEGPSLKHDISVPVAAIPLFLADAGSRLERILPGIRPCPFGHMGDGNIHYNLSAPVDMDKDEFLARRDGIATVVHDIVRIHGGSISAEHGIGRDKVTELERLGDPTALATMRAIKMALDPLNILNPGRVIRLQNAPQ